MSNPSTSPANHEAEGSSPKAGKAVGSSDHNVADVEDVDVEDEHEHEHSDEEIRQRKKGDRPPPVSHA